MTWDIASSGILRRLASARDGGDLDEVAFLLNQSAMDSRGSARPLEKRTVASPATPYRDAGRPWEWPHVGLTRTRDSGNQYESMNSVIAGRGHLGWWRSQAEISTDQKVGSLSVPSVSYRERARHVPDGRVRSGIRRILTDN